ncbi:MAG: tRNA lysidine(34) synthetase TilS [Gammaproteobacteria bacterium]|nr:tRNA lysidine(34) synthetase TilS [Gammaproteobacteria bacterium]
MREFSTNALLEVIRQWPAAPACRVAFSGGLDSTVLLHALCALREALPGRLSAIHINHGLHARAGDWDLYCRAVCGEWGIGFESFAVDARPIRGRSPEDLARELRYARLKEHLRAGEIVLTAHNQDDQAETLLLQLCRGAGPAGLSGMPPLRPFGAGFHARPLLGWPRAALARYAAGHDLRWVEDSSNTDPAFDRNFIRQELMLALRARWPGIGATLSRAAQVQAEAQAILQETAESDLARCRGAEPHRLPLDQLKALTAPRQSNLLRCWLASLSMPLPARTHLDSVRAQLLASRRDTLAKVSWPGAEVRRFQDELWAFAPLPPRDARGSTTWCLGAPLTLAHGTLSARLVQGRGLRRSALENDSVDVRYRRGGESILPAGDRHHRSLKKLLQQAHVPPWLRYRLPLLYSGDLLVAVADLWVDASVAAVPADAGWEFQWRDHGAI